MIWPSVRDVFYRWNGQYEGVAFCMYADILGLVTTGVGNLLPLQVALVLPWKRTDGSLASQAEIEAAWSKIDKNMEAARRGADYACTLTDLRLSEEAVDALVQDRLDQNAEVLARRFPDFPDWPADAQLAVLSMAWAMGAGFRFPKFEALVLDWRFAEAAEEATIREDGNPGVIPRNRENKRLLIAAQRKVDNGGDFSELSFDYTGLPKARTFGEPAPGDASDASIPWTGLAIGAALGVGAVALILGPAAAAAIFAPVGAVADAAGRQLGKIWGSIRGRLQSRERSQLRAEKRRSRGTARQLHD